MKCNFTSLEKPEVILSDVCDAVYDTKVTYKATIRSFLKHTFTKWKRGDNIIDITKPKYEGSSNVGYCPVLCINNVSKEDEDVYSIHVRNEWGYTPLSYKKLVVTGSKCHLFSSFELLAQVSLTDYSLPGVLLFVRLLTFSKFYYVSRTTA